jgi:uncharacterized protein (DUF983 family)
MLTLFVRGLLDPDGVHAHTRDDCPRVRRLHPGELRNGFSTLRTECPACTELLATKRTRTAALKVSILKVSMT